MPLPDLNHEGELPEGIHEATIDEVIAQFGGGTSTNRNRIGSQYFLDTSLVTVFRNP